MAAKKDELRFGVDLTEVEEADDGDTTRYGGAYRLDGDEFPAAGDDRSDNHFAEILEKLHERCVKAWPKSKKVLEDEDFRDALYEAVHGCAPDGTADLFDVVVTKKGSKFTVENEGFSRASRDKADAKLTPAVRGAKEIGDLLGDLLVEHLGENEDWLARSLADSIEENPICKKAEVVRNGKEVYPADLTKKLALDEAMGYLRLAIEPILWKALNPETEG